jgi:nucleoside-diphosphate-sugar epimerase
MKITVVVTGASGFIGRALIKEFRRAKNLTVVPVARTNMGSPCICVDSYLDTPCGDVLIHTAEEANRSRANLFGSTYLKKSGGILCGLIEKKYTKIIYCSSAVVYGDYGNQLFTEKSPVIAEDIYVKAKQENENRVLDADGIVVRLANVIGPGMSTQNVVSDILNQLSKEGPITVRNDKPVRDFICIDDVTNAMKILVNEGISGIYNLGSGTGTSVRELATMVLDIAGVGGRKIISQVINSKPSFNVLNIDKMSRLCGWTPTINLYNCIRNIINENRKKSRTNEKKSDCSIHG